MPKRERQSVWKARRSGDTDRLYAALKAEAERQFEKIRVANSTYVEIRQEIETLESLRGDYEHA